MANSIAVIGLGDKKSLAPQPADAEQAHAATMLAGYLPGLFRFRSRKAIVFCRASLASASR
jgi:hypothetical protein